MDGIYLGNEATNGKITLIDWNKFKKKNNGFQFGTAGTGRGFFVAYKCAVAAQENYIVSNHLNNNNRLKQHDRPMIRKGHGYYKLIKKLKKEKPMKIIVFDPDKEYESLSKLPGVCVCIIDGVVNPLAINHSNL